MRKLTSLLIASTLLVSGCAFLRSYKDSEISTLDDFDELMVAQYKGTNDAFDLIGKETLSDEDFAEVNAAGTRLGLTAPRLKEPGFSKGAEFDGFAETLAMHAGELVKAAAAKDSAGAQTALVATKQTCAACHKKFK